MYEKISLLLKDYGLTSSEITVFLNLVENKELTAYKIAKYTRIHRSTVYDILERLVEKGFVSKKIIDETTFYSTNKPSTIISHIKDKENIIMSLTPELKRIKSVVKREIMLLTGEKSQKEFDFNLFESFKSGEIKEIYIIGNSPPAHFSSNLFIESLLREGIKINLFKKVKYKGIWDIKFKKSRAVKLYEPFGENRFIENLPGIVTTAIYGDIVSFLYKAETPEVIQIKNNLLAREIRGYFDKLWAISSI